MAIFIFAGEGLLHNTTDTELWDHGANLWDWRLVSVKGTFITEGSNMLGTRKKRPDESGCCRPDGPRHGSRFPSLMSQK